MSRIPPEHSHNQNEKTKHFPSATDARTARFRDSSELLLPDQKMTEQSKFEQEIYVLTNSHPLEI